MTPRVDGEVHWFAEQALYDGLFLMKDEETETYWDHMTGEAVYGPLVGERLEVAGLVQSTVRQVLSTEPGALITLSDQAIRSDDDMKVDGLLAGIRGRLNRMFQSTVADDDDRRPQMDLGLGLWADDEARYYPMDVIRAEGRALVDSFGGRTVLVYIDPSNFVPSALLVDGDDPRWEDDVLRLSDGLYIEDGLAYEADGSRSDALRPLQVFTRWYGFSLTFPETGIYGEAEAR
jgi:hypothetical protein